MCTVLWLLFFERTSYTICIHLYGGSGGSEETLTKNIAKKTQQKSYHTPTATVMWITTNDKKYHFSGYKKKKRTNKPSAAKPKARVYKFNSIKKYFAPVYVSFKKPFKCFFHTSFFLLHSD